MHLHHSLTASLYSCSVLQVANWRLRCQTRPRWPFIYLLVIIKVAQFAIHDLASLSGRKWGGWGNQTSFRSIIIIIICMHAGLENYLWDHTVNLSSFLFDSFFINHHFDCTFIPLCLDVNHEYNWIFERIYLLFDRWLVFVAWHIMTGLWLGSWSFGLAKWNLIYCSF